jgi:hypothetical protein
VREGVGDKLSTVFYNSNSDGKFSIKERRGMGRTEKSSLGGARNHSLLPPALKVYNRIFYPKGNRF